MLDTATGTLTTYSKDVFSLVAEVSTITFVVLGVLFALLILALHFGKEFVISLNFGLYLGYLAYRNFPYLTKARELGGDYPDWWFDIAIFIGFTLFAFFIIRRVIGSDFSFGGETRWLDALLLSVSTTLLIAALTYALFPIPHTPILTPLVTDWLSDPGLFFWWLIIPLISIFIVSRR